MLVYEAGAAAMNARLIDSIVTYLRNIFIIYTSSYDTILKSEIIYILPIETDDLSSNSGVISMNLAVYTHSRRVRAVGLVNVIVTKLYQKHCAVNSCGTSGMIAKWNYNPGSFVEACRWFFIDHAILFVAWRFHHSSVLRHIQSLPKNNLGNC